MANIGIKPGDKVVEKGITRIQKLVDDLRRDLNTETSNRIAGTTTTTTTTATGEQHSEEHTIESHTGTGVTSEELETLTDGSNADALHVHDSTLTGHTIASHLDTSATGAELNTLTDGWSEDASELHSHSVANLNDFDGTSGDLNTLREGDTSNASHLHIHDDRYYTDEELGSIGNGLGGDLIGIYDAGGIISAENVADALQENRNAIDAIEDNTLTANGGNGITASDGGTVGENNQQVTITADCDGSSIVNTEGSGAQIGIKDDGVESNHYATGSIDLEHMSDDSVDSPQYVDDSIDEDHINWGTDPDQVSAEDIPVADSEDYWTTDDVESVLDEIGANTIAGGQGITSVGNIGDGTQQIDVDLADLNPCLRFEADKLEAKINTTTSNKRLLKEFTGIAIDESINPTWTGSFHTFTKTVKAYGQIQVSDGDPPDSTLRLFPIQIKPTSTGEILSSYRGDDREGFGIIGGSWLNTTFDPDFGAWS